MQTAKYLLFTESAITIVSVFNHGNTDENINEPDQHSAKLSHELMKVSGTAADLLADLRRLFSAKIEGLSEETRQRIESIIDHTAENIAANQTNSRIQLS